MHESHAPAYARRFWNHRAFSVFRYTPKHPARIGDDHSIFVTHLHYGDRDIFPGRKRSAPTVAFLRPCIRGSVADRANRPADLTFFYGDRRHLRFLLGDGVQPCSKYEGQGTSADGSFAFSACRRGCWVCQFVFRMENTGWMGLVLYLPCWSFRAAWPDLFDERPAEGTCCQRCDHKLHRTDLCIACGLAAVFGTAIS